MARIGCKKCGRGKTPRDDNVIFSLVSDAMSFISLVDAGAGTKSFERRLGLTREQIIFHLGHLNLYKRTIAAYIKMQDYMKQYKNKNLSAPIFNERIQTLRNIMWTDGDLDEIQKL